MFLLFFHLHSKKEDTPGDANSFKFSKIEPGSPKTISTVNLLNTTNDNVSIASSSPDQQPPEVALPPERCATCGKLSVHGDSDEDEDENGRKTSESDEDCITMKPKPGGSTTLNYLIAVHRNLCRQDTYFLSHHKTRPGLFGVPLLIPCYEGVSNKQLYCAVWTQVSRLLSKLPPTPPDQANHATDW